MSSHFSPDSQRIASANSLNGSVSLWNIQGLKDQPTVIRAHSKRINSVEFSPDGSYLVTASDDGMVRLWTVGIPELTQIACHAARRNFTQEEWERFFGEKPYERTCDEWPIHTSVVQTMYDQAHAQAEQGDIPGATAKFREAMALDPSLKVEPETEAKRLYASKVVDQARSLAEQGDISGATAKFTEALALDPSLKIVPEAEAKRLYAPKMVAQGSALAEQGDIASATAKFKEALALDPTLDIKPEAALSWNELCWNGAIWNQAALVLDTCETAVKLAPDDGKIRGSRGLARALTGNTTGACGRFRVCREMGAGNRLWRRTSSRRARLGPRRCGRARIRR